ncbi:class I SAM-dependent methyltransferase [Massilia sp. W12]|uniref:class I SAM-dependent methyltransferase n=1 Tax=Massilia sp. W12 TaxID=3126507 RepID=UPI0030D32B4C
MQNHEGSDTAFDSAREMRAYYAARAPYYDRVYLQPERAADLAFLQAHLAHVLAGRRVLEVACGTGYWTQWIAPHAAAYTATDGVAEPLAFARLRPHCAQVRFALADAYALGAELGEFDAAFAGLWFSHVPIERRGAFLQSLHARLAPGARVILLDNSRVQCRDYPLVERDALGNTWQMRPLDDGTQRKVLKNFPEQAEMTELLAASASHCAWRELDNFWLFEYELQKPD